MKQTIKRVLAALLAAGLLVLCACSAKTAPAQEQETEQTAAVETAPAEQPQEAASVGVNTGESGRLSANVRRAAGGEKTCAGGTCGAADRAGGARADGRAAGAGAA